MGDLAATIRVVLAVSNDAGGSPPACPTASEWDALLRGTPGQCHPWIAACAERRFAGQLVPDTVRARLSAASRSAAIGHLRRQSLLRQVGAALDAANVPFVVLKGAAVAHTVYPNPSLRTMGDLDLWTLPDDLDRAAAVLVDAGLRDHTPLTERSPASRQLSVQSTRVLEAPDCPLFVELHGILKSLNGVSQDWLANAWRRCERRRLGDVEANVLHPEDILTHLVVHCGRLHRFEYGVRALVDIGLLLERDGCRLSWPDLFGCWRREGIETWALLALALARDVVGAPVPADVVARFEGDAAFAELEATARQQVLAWEAPLPPGMAYLVTSSPRERASWLFYRLTTWYWTGPPGHRRPPAEVLREGARRIEYDIRKRLPRYVRGFVDGAMRGSEFRRRRIRARSRLHIDAMVTAIEGTRHALKPSV